MESRNGCNKNPPVVSDYSPCVHRGREPGHIALFGVRKICEFHANNSGWPRVLRHLDDKCDRGRGVPPKRLFALRLGDGPHLLEAADDPKRWSLTSGSMPELSISRICAPTVNSCHSLVSKDRSNSSPRDVKETELFEDGLRRDALDLRLGVMQKRGRHPTGVHSSLG